VAYRYLKFWKPYGVLSQFTPEPGSAHATLAEYVKVPNVYPVGRLDWDSEGLMLLTDDGGLQHRFTDPKFEHPRTYWAQVEGEVTAAAIAALEQGVLIQGQKTRPAQARAIAAAETAHLPPRVVPIRYRANIPTSWIELTLTEGRNRQVRRMTAAVGYPTLRLLRVRMGELSLDGLAPGAWREISAPKVPQSPGSGQRGKTRSRSTSGFRRRSG
jgi:23S rRNA pseudouridine2457 synthase